MRFVLNEIYQKSFSSIELKTCKGLGGKYYKNKGKRSQFTLRKDDLQPLHRYLTVFYFMDI